MKKFALAALAALLVIPSAFAEGEAYQSMVASHAAAGHEASRELASRVAGK